MEFNNPMTEAAAYRLGQQHGAIAGVIASAAAYWLFKAYRPSIPFKVKKKEDES